MARELPRTLALARARVPAGDRGRRLRGDRRRQRVARAARRGRARCLRRPGCAQPGSIPAPPTPARAANLGIEMARERLRRPAHRRRSYREPRAARDVQLARRAGRRGRSSQRWAGISAPALPHGCARLPATTRPPRTGCSPSSDWEHDGYRLFSHQHARGVVGARLVRARWGRATGCSWRSRCGRSSAASTSASRCRAAGSSNHDLYRRACELDGAQLVVLLGEGTFHQIHGGAATSGRDRLGRDARRVREAARSPVPAAARTIGSTSAPFPTTALPHVEHVGDSARSSCARLTRRRNGSAQSLEEAAGVERERRTSPWWCRRELAGVLDEDALHRFAPARDRTRATPDGRSRSCSRRSRRSRPARAARTP